MLRAVDAAGRRIDDADQHVDFFGLHDRGRRDVPEVFADQHAHAAEPRRVETPETACRAKSSAALRTVRRSADRPCDARAASRPASAIEGRVVELVPVAFLDEARHQRHRAGRLDQLRDLEARAAPAPPRAPCRAGSSRSATARERRSGRPLAAGPPRSAPDASPDCAVGRPAPERFVPAPRAIPRGARALPAQRRPAARYPLH